jgi:ubiquinone/menaquinone biosynthesis C-methylase UbiE
LIHRDGWDRFNIWNHSASVERLYEQRCRRQATELTCHAQIASLFKELVAAGDSLLDAGCGTGYFYHSLERRGVDAKYFGIDATDRFISIARRWLPAWGVPEKNLSTLRIEDLYAEVDHVACINVLTNIDNYHKPLERLLLTAKKTVILRESCAEESRYSYVRDRYLDLDLNVYVNTYSIFEFTNFIKSYGYDVQVVRDERTGGQPEMVIDYPHYWKIFVCRRLSSA